MGPYLGDYPEDDTVHFIWDTNDSNGASITRATDGSLRIYKDNGVSEKLTGNGITDTEDFDSLTGIHVLTIDTSNDTGDAGFWVPGNYTVVLQGATIDGQSVNSVLCHFSIDNRSVVNQITSLNDPSAATIADAVWDEVSSGHVDAGKAGEQLWTDVDAILADTNELQADDTPTSIAAVQTTVDAIETDTQDLQGRTPASLVSGRTSADAVAISGSTDAADKLEASAETVVIGTVDSGTFTPTSTKLEADDITEATADHYNGRIMIFTSGDLSGQATDITDYELANGKGKFTFTALTEAAANDVTFVVV